MCLDLFQLAPQAARSPLHPHRFNRNHSYLNTSKFWELFYPSLHNNHKPNSLYPVTEMEVINKYVTFQIWSYNNTVAIP